METLNKYYKIARSVYSEELTLKQFKAAFKQIEEGRAELHENMSKKTVKSLKNILNQMGSYHDSRHKKADLVEKVCDNLRTYFYLGRGISYMMGDEGGHDAAEMKLINGTTEESLKAFYDKRREEREEKEKAEKNPETLQEFKIFIDKFGEDALSNEQKEVRERLIADSLLKHQEREAEQKAVVTKVEAEGVEFKLHPTKHSKTGVDIFTVVMLSRVEREVYKELNGKAKQLGGYYSRFSNKNAQPPIKAGFNFNTEKEALKFMGLTEGSQSAQENQEEKAEEVKQSAADRMKERAAKMIEKAEGELNQDRRTNTHRQASQAASTEGRLRSEISFGKKLIQIANGLEDGSIKYLHALRNGKQLEQLETILRRGFNKRLDSLNLSYTEKQGQEAKPLEDVNFIEYPFPCYHLDTVESVFGKYSETKGMIQDIARILKDLKRAPRNGHLIRLKGEYSIGLYKRAALKFTDKWDKERILNQIQDFERLQKMGLTNEAMLKTALRELAELTKGTGISEEEKKEIETKELERSFIGKKINGFFPTPQPLIEEMLAMAKVFEGETIREPSAGLGHIAEQIRIMHPANTLHVNECNYSLADVLDKKGFNTTTGDFLEETGKTDVIFMNPPFENNQDIDHVKHAFSLLNDGGRLVAIMAGNKNGSNKKVVEFMELVNEHGYIKENEAGSFKSAFNSTGVNTCTVYLEKPINIEEDDSDEEEETTKQEAREDAIQCKGRSEQLSLF